MLADLSASVVLVYELYNIDNNITVMNAGTITNFVMEALNINSGFGITVVFIA